MDIKSLSRQLKPIENPTVKRIMEESRSGVSGAGRVNNPSAKNPEKSDEIERYFPDLYSGKVSSSKMQKHFDIEKEIQADPEREKLYEASREFQSIFIGQMLKSMRKTLNKENDMLYGGNRQDIFEDMLYDQYAKAMSESGSFSLADQIYSQLSSGLPTLSKDKLENLEPVYPKNKAREYLKNLNPSVSTDQIKDYRNTLE